MRKTIGAAVMAVIVAIAGVAMADAVKALDAASEASGVSKIYDTGGGRAINVQVCGTGFSGTVLVKQGEGTSSLVTTYTWTLTSNSDCTNYRKFEPSTYTQITYTRSAGSVSAYIGTLR